MTKSDLMIILTDKKSHLSYQTVEDAVKEVFNCMSDALGSGERIEIRGFGSFSLRYRAARDARNPKTGAILTTTSKYAVHFKPGKELRERVNSRKQQREAV